MNPRFVIGTDFSSTSEAALELAVTFQKRYHGTLHLIHVVEYPGRFSGAERRDLYEETQSDLAKAKLGEIKKDMAKRGVEITSEVRIGEVSKELLAMTKEGNCDMLFMGIHGNREVNPLFLGSVTLALLKESDVPLMLTRIPVVLKEGDWQGIAPVSRDYGLRMVMSFLKNNDWGFEICLDIVHVLLPGHSDADAQHFMEDKMKEISDAGLCNVDATLMIGDTVTDSLLEYMDHPQKPADLLILESRPHHEFGSMTLGGNLEKLILGSRRPVLCLSSEMPPKA